MQKKIFPQSSVDIALVVGSCPLESRPHLSLMCGIICSAKCSLNKFIHFIHIGPVLLKPNVNEIPSSNFRHQIVGYVLTGAIFEEI